MDDLEKSKLLQQREVILSKMKCFINEVLNPSNNTQFNPDLSIQEILSSLNISEKEYYSVLSISSNSDNKIHLKRS